MLLLVMNIEWQTSNMSNKTFEPTEQLISKRMLRNCLPRLSIRPARKKISAHSICNFTSRGRKMKAYNINDFAALIGIDWY